MTRLLITLSLLAGMLPRLAAEPSGIETRAVETLGQLLRKGADEARTLHVRCMERVYHLRAQSEREAVGWANVIQRNLCKALGFPVPRRIRTRARRACALWARRGRNCMKPILSRRRPTVLSLSISMRLMSVSSMSA